MNSNSSSRNFIPMANKYDRVILLVDMDCFYCQVEEKLDPSLKGQPLAVVQYNAWRGGGIIAVNYAARAKGVTRHMRGDEAKEQCPEIKLVKVPNIREKADLSKYRDAGKEVANVLQRFTPLLERASVDEAYLDITEAVNKRLQQMNEGTFVLQPQELVNTYAVGYETIGEFVTSITTSFILNPLDDDDHFYRNFNETDVPAVRQSNIRLLIGASIASEIRNAVKSETSYECSAGIAYNKILAKLACGINKPNKQTVLPLAQIPKYFETLPIGKIKGLGAKFGEDICERLNVRYLGQLLKFTEAELQRKFDEKNGTWLYNICRGIDLEAVTPRFYSKSIGCCKKFPGRNNITGLKTLQHWLNELANEINERLEKDICENNRRAKQMVVSFIQEFDGEEVSSSRSAPLQSYDAEMLATTSLEVIKSNTKQFFRSGSESALNNPIKFLGISVGKFETISNSKNNIQEMFAQQAAKKQKLQEISIDEKQQTVLSTTIDRSAVKSNHNAATESGNNSPKQKSNERNVEKSFLINARNPNSVEISTAFKTAKELISSSLEKTPTQENSRKIKSFFLNALKKGQSTENRKSTENIRCNVDDNVKAKTNYDMQTSNENEAISLIASEEKAHSNAPQTSFFARALKTREKEQTLKTNNTCSDLNIINNIQYEENFDIIVAQNEDENYLSSSINRNDIVESNLETPESNLLKKRKHENILEGDELRQKDYRSQYVEFAVPELREELLKYTNCPKCGDKILDEPVSIQTHQDHHFAQELSQQQRHEFRDEVRSKLISTKSSPNDSNKKLKKSSSNNSIKKTSTGITKFLKPSDSTTLSSSLTSSENEATGSSSALNFVTCDICKLPIKVEDVLEHKDFHMAKDLQRKLNQLEVRTVELVKKSTSDSSRRSINSSLNMSSRNAKPTTKPITQFFTQSNI